MAANACNPKDEFDMLSMLRAFPEQFTRALAWFPADLTFPKVEKALLCGLGGSALPGDIVNALWIEQCRLEISREYHLPVWVGKETLVILSSFSGNTEETLSSYQQAHDKGLPVCVITKGGKLAEMAKTWGDPLLIIDEQTNKFQPRFASGYFYAFITLTLWRAGLLTADIPAHLQQVASLLKPDELDAPAQALAGRLKDTLPLFYASGSYAESVARICKIKVNENSKAPAFFNTVPELNHNEMVGFTNTLNIPFHVVFLRDRDDFHRVQARYDEMKKLFLESKDIKYKFSWEELWLEGDSPAEKIFRTLLLGDFATYYLALLYGYDPTPVPIVENFKKAIG